VCSVLYLEGSAWLVFMTLDVCGKCMHTVVCKRAVHFLFSGSQFTQQCLVVFHCIITAWGLECTVEYFLGIIGCWWP